MNLLPAMILYLSVGCGEWYLALRRTLACARGEKTLLVCIVFIENLLGLWVLSNFIRTNNWLLALSYSAGASMGALIVTVNFSRAGSCIEPPVVKSRERPISAVHFGKTQVRNPTARASRPFHRPTSADIEHPH